MKKAIFLDRDGTINIDYGYISRPGDFHLIPRSGQSLRALQDRGFLLIIITNQSGIGRDYYTLSDFLAVNSVMQEKLESFGVRISDIFYCPHDPDERCSCRKPSARMVLEAAKKWSIDLQRSFFIGDKTSDILCGKNAGCRTIRLSPPEIRPREKRTDIVEQADYTVRDLAECIPVIDRVSKLQSRPEATAVIPARLKSSRLPYKLLQNINGIPLLTYTYKNIKSMNIFREVVIVTDSARIARLARSLGARSMMTSPDHPSGTARISEIAHKIRTPVVVNIQGDEPLLSVSHLDRMIAYLSGNSDALAATAVTPARNRKEIISPSVVKAVMDRRGYALYFSRHPIPFVRDKVREPVRYKHLGIYGYRKRFFRLFKGFVPSPLEESEKLEQLTFLANGVKIRLFETANDTLGIDVREELDRFRELVAAHPEYFHRLLSK